MPLLSLPTELLQIIANFCGPGPDDLSGLARTNARLHDIANPILWRLGIDDPESFTEMTARAAEAGNLHILKKAASFGANLDIIHPVPMPDEMLLKELGGEEWPEDECSHLLWAAPLHLAVYHGFHEMVEWLISYGVDIEAPGHLFCHCKGTEDYEDDLGIGLCVENHPCWTSLHFAICQNHDTIARLLLRKGASTDTMIDIETIHFEGRLCQSLQRLYQLNDFNWYAASRCAAKKVTALHTASELGRRSLVEHLVRDWQIDINEPDSMGRTPIYYPMLSSDQGMIAHLASLGADLNYLGDEMPEELNLTPLGWALTKRLYKAVCHLLENGASTWYGVPKALLMSQEFLSHYGLNNKYHREMDPFPGHWKSSQLIRSNSQERSYAISKLFRHTITSYKSEEYEYKSIQTIGFAVADFLREKATKTRHVKELFNDQYHSNMDEVMALGSETLNELIRSITWSPQLRSIHLLLQFGVYPRNGDISPLHNLLVSLQKILNSYRATNGYFYNEMHVTRMVDLVNDLTEHEQWDSVSKADMTALVDVCVKVLRIRWGQFAMLKVELRDSLFENLPQEFQQSFTEE